MIRIVALFVVLACGSVIAGAQSFTDKLQQSQQGQGRVVVTESKDIDALVNGTNQTANKTKNQSSQSVRTNQASQTAHAVAPKPNEEKKVVARTETATPHVAETVTPAQKQHVASAEEKPHEEHAATVRHSVKETAEEEATTSTTVRKKVNRGWRKVKGYRVQAYSGSNTRQSRQMAEKAGNAIKAKFPDQPVYVHFYSPSWKCRVGNFRSYAEAERLMKQIRRMGYKSACVVSGTITVQPE